MAQHLHAPMFPRADAPMGRCPSRVAHPLGRRWDTHRDVSIGSGVAAAGARGGFAVQDVLLDHLQLPVLDGDVAVPQRDEDGLRVLPRQPLIRLQGRLRARRVGVQVVLEEVRLQGEMSRSGALGLEGSSGLHVMEGSSGLHSTPAASWAHLSRDGHDDGLAFPLVKLEEPFQKKK